MTILIANIGTSDLAVKIDDYYLPIGFDRNEPNHDVALAELNENENEKWKARQNLIATNLCEELKVNYNPKSYRFSFRELTAKIFDAYQQSPETWHQRLSPGRIWGVIKTALDNNVTKIYIFVTNQPAELTNPLNQTVKNPGYDTDSIHLFQILQSWFEHEIGKQIPLIDYTIPKTIPAIDQDGLLGEYYNFFNQFNKDEKILVSVKGGTPQMQTALRVQAMSSDILTQIYLEPDLSIKNILYGKPSECQRVSYWRYQRVQKYQVAKKLLQRWDFDGTREILGQWNDNLKDLSKWHLENSEELEQSQVKVEEIVNLSGMAVALLNLDTQEAQNLLINDFKPFMESYLSNPLERLRNLYTQCCIFEEVDKFADLLMRMGLFYEEILHELIRRFDGNNGNNYFNRQKSPDNWLLKTKEVLRNSVLAQKFYAIEAEMPYSSLITAINNQIKYNSKKQINPSKKVITKKNNKKTDKWTTPLNKEFKLPGRLTKRNFLEALVYATGDAEKIAQCNLMVDAMKKLDYWAIKRNQIVHGAKGISLQRAAEVRQEDIELARQASEGDDIEINKDIPRTVKSSCLPEDILKEMKTIAENAFKLVDEPWALSIISSSLSEEDLTEESFYYIYSDIRHWIIQCLQQDIQTNNPR